MYFNDFDNFFDNILNNFNRPVKDMQPCKMYALEDGKYAVVVNTLGVDKTDLEVNLSKKKGNPYPVLKVKGQTKIEKLNIVNSTNLEITVKLQNEIEDVSYTTKNGLTFIYIKTKKEPEKQISAKMIDDDGSFDF